VHRGRSTTQEGIYSAEEKGRILGWSAGRCAASHVRMRGSAWAKSSQKNLLWRLSNQASGMTGTGPGMGRNGNAESQLEEMPKIQSGRRGRVGKSPKFLDKDCQEGWNFPQEDEHDEEGLSRYQIGQVSNKERYRPPHQEKSKRNLASQPLIPFLCSKAKILSNLCEVGRHCVQQRRGVRILLRRHCVENC
jgi:hypothetical protein